MLCQNCNVRIREGAGFCPECGAKVESRIVQPPPPERPAKRYAYLSVTPQRYTALRIVVVMGQIMGILAVAVGVFIVIEGIFEKDIIDLMIGMGVIFYGFLLYAVFQLFDVLVDTESNTRRAVGLLEELLNRTPRQLERESSTGWKSS